MRINRLFRWLGGALLAAGLWARAENSAAVAEVLKLKTAGLNEETMLSYVRGKGVNYDLSSDSVIALRNYGLPESVISAMLASGSGSGPVTAAPLPVALGPEAAYFEPELRPHGRWLLAEDRLWYWQPTLVLTSPGWRPYWDGGHWVNSEQGWYWVSDYSWGGVVFHYGRWQLHPRHGWIWLPDRIWGPSWVAWRTGGDYCGWAPLPPGARFDVAAGIFLFRGRRVEAGFDFGLDSHHFNFCRVREMGQPPNRVFRRRVEVEAAYRQTSLVGHYAVDRTTHVGDARVINHGIDPAVVAAARGRPVETVRIHEVPQPVKGRGRERVDTRQKTIEVYRPRHER